MPTFFEALGAPENQGLLGMSQGLLAAGGPSQHPVSATQGLAAGIGGFMQGNDSARQYMMRKMLADSVVGHQTAQNQYMQAQTGQLQNNQQMGAQKAALLQGVLSRPGSVEDKVGMLASLGLLAEADALQKTIPKNQAMQTVIGPLGPQLVQPREYGLPQRLEGMAPVQDVNKPFTVGPGNAPVPNNPFQQYELGRTAVGANRTQVNVNSFLPASEEAQRKYIDVTAKNREALQNAAPTLRNIEEAKKLVPGAKSFMGTGGEPLLEAAKFLNNRLGTDIKTEGIKDAEELRSRIFFQILDNLKKMDAQPSQQQQKVMQEALGNLGTDPNALPRILDAFGNVIREKVSIHNKDVTEAEKRMVKFPFRPQVDLPEELMLPQSPTPQPGPSWGPDKEKRYQELLNKQKQGK